MFFQNHRLHRRRHLQQQREKIELPDRGFQIMSSRGEDEKVKDSVFARMEEINDAAGLAFARSVC